MISGLATNAGRIIVIDYHNLDHYNIIIIVGTQFTDLINYALLSMFHLRDIKGIY